MKTYLRARRASPESSGDAAMARGKAWATVAFLLGIAVSVAANVAHTWHPGEGVLRRYALVHGSAQGWRPEVGAQIGAATYPVALLLTVEILSRVAWPAGKAWNLARFGGAGMVALVSAIVSYRHMSGLLGAYGEDWLTAAIGPLAVDGLMVVASMALLAIGRTHTDEPGVPPPVDPATISLDLPANHRQVEQMPADPFPPTPEATAAWLEGTDVPEAETRVPEVPDQDRPVPESQDVPEREGVPESVGVSAAVPDVPDLPEVGGVPERHHREAVEVFGEQVGAGRVPSIRAIRKALHVGQGRAQEVKAYLSVLANQ